MKSEYHKKAVSGVLATVLLVGLVIVLMVLVWGFVNNFVNENTENSEKCYNAHDKIRLVDQFTCYNSSSKKLYFGIAIDDIELEGVSITVYSDMQSKTFYIPSSGNSISFLSFYGDERGEPVNLPGPESSESYIFYMDEAGLSSNPESIEITPVFEEKCQISDTIYNIEECISFG
jgi:hypothetical protein